ncbi:MAG: AarF/UbiB family protein [Microthrixaceae bacterium]|nr:AarF/UbiB family protein [Microthrixaceae bacterium]
MSTERRLLFDPSRLDLPDLDELVAGSDWVSGVPGLADQVDDWVTEVAERRPRLRARARRLARAGVDRSMAEGMGRLMGERRGAFALEDVLGVLRRPGSLAEFGSQQAVDRVERFVRAGGPAWVKLGQFVATADGLLPGDWVEAFAWCRDDVPPLPEGVPRKVVRRAFNARVRDVFAEFDDEPLGAASIAQVHRAVLPDGREVVVKIRRPGLRQRFTNDIRAMAAAAWMAERLHPVVRTGNPSGFLELFAQLVLEELDFRIEALNMVELRGGRRACRIRARAHPRPMPGLVTSRVLVMERLPGRSYTSVHVDPEVGRRLFRFAVQSALELTLLFGVFHGDLHAGNILLDEDSGMLSLVDFGILGRLDEAQRIALGQLMVAFAHGDVRRELEAMVDFGAIPADFDLSVLEGRSGPRPIRTAWIPTRTGLSWPRPSPACWQWCRVTASDCPRSWCCSARTSCTSTGSPRRWPRIRGSSTRWPPCSPTSSRSTARPSTSPRSCRTDHPLELATPSNWPPPRTGHPLELTGVGHGNRGPHQSVRR